MPVARDRNRNELTAAGRREFQPIQQLVPERYDVVAGRVGPGEAVVALEADDEQAALLRVRQHRLGDAVDEVGPRQRQRHRALLPLADDAGPLRREQGHLDPRGSDGRLPTLWGANLSLGYPVNFGAVTVTPQAYLYNVFNSDYANSVNTTFSTTASNQFLRPTAVILGRLFKIGGQIDF